jgi:hypothetical protein
MADTTYTANVTPITADTMNDLNRLHYTIFGDPATAAAARTTLLTYSGTYTPTFTNTLNLDGSTASDLQYIRVGSVVTVSGVVQIDPTTASTVQMGISIPVASNFTNSGQAGGSGNSTANENERFAIYADATNDRVVMDGLAASTSNHAVWVHFTYLII